MFLAVDKEFAQNNNFAEMENNLLEVEDSLKNIRSEKIITKAKSGDPGHSIMCFRNVF